MGNIVEELKHTEKILGEKWGEWNGRPHRGFSVDRSLENELYRLSDRCSELRDMIDHITCKHYWKCVKWNKENCCETEQCIRCGKTRVMPLV